MKHALKRVATSDHVTPRPCSETKSVSNRVWLRTGVCFHVAYGAARELCRKFGPARLVMANGRA